MIKTRAYINIALTKYWGKKDEKLNIPHYPTISFTTNQFYTDVVVEKSNNPRYYINDELVNDFEKEKIDKYLSLVYELYQINKFDLIIKSYSHVPIGKGLASSASFYCALALALNEIYQMGLNQEELSRLARLGSGSASRSIYKGFVKWEDKDDMKSVAKPLNVNWEDFIMLVPLKETAVKKISSREAMKLAVKHKTYQSYVKKQIKDNKKMEFYLNQKNIYKVGKIAEKNALRMHRLIEKTNIYFLDNESYLKIKEIKSIRKMHKIPVYITADAGNIVILITLKSQLDKLKKYLNLDNYIVLEEGEDAVVIKN